MGICRRLASILKHTWSLWLTLALLLAACQNNETAGQTGSSAATGAMVDPEPLVYQRYQNEAGFDILYPEGWQFLIPRQGIIVFGTLESLNLTNNEPAVTLVVHRYTADPGRDLAANFGQYLESGPLVSGFVARDEVRRTELNGREAFQVTVETDPDLPDRPATTLYMVGTQADSGMTYIISATAPQAEWEIWWPRFQVMTSSFVLNE